MKITQDMNGKEVRIAVVYKDNVLELISDTCYLTPRTAIFHFELTNKDLRLLEVFKKEQSK